MNSFNNQLKIQPNTFITIILNELKLIDYQYPSNIETKFDEENKKYIMILHYKYGDKIITPLFEKYYNEQYRDNYKNENLFDELNDGKIHIIMNKIFSYLMEVLQFKIREAKIKDNIVISINYHHSTIFKDFLFTYLLN